MKNSLKNKFQSEYENLSERPSQDLWERLENKLENISEEKKGKNIVKFSFWKVAAIVLLLISMGLLINQFTHSEQKLHENVVVKNNENSKKIEKIINNPIKKSSENQEYASSENNIIKKTRHSEMNFTKQQKHEGKEIASVQIPEKFEDSPVIKEALAKEENISPLKKEKIKYITAEDLLFEREAGKSLKEQNNDHKRLGDLGVKLERPKTVKVLGVTIYSDENE